MNKLIVKKEFYSDKLKKISESVKKNSSLEMAQTLLILSSHEVPHDKGLLSSSGQIFKDVQGHSVAYNKEYASFQHEGIRRDGTHKIVNYQKGRKKKYLEDPLKLNLPIWQKILFEKVKKFL